MLDSGDGVALRSIKRAHAGVPRVGTGPPTQETIMARTSSSFDPLHDTFNASAALLQMNQRWLEGWLSLQSALWSACIQVQAEWARPLVAGELPNWMVWQNGTEQLA
jgi:acyl dehydratase